TDYIRLETDQFGGKGRESVILSCGKSRLDDDVPALHIPKVTEPRRNAWKLEPTPEDTPGVEETGDKNPTRGILAGACPSAIISAFPLDLIRLHFLSNCTLAFDLTPHTRKQNPVQSFTANRIPVAQGIRQPQ